MRNRPRPRDDDPRAFYHCGGCGGLHSALTLGRACGEEATRYTAEMLDALYPGWLALTPAEVLAAVSRSITVKARHARQLKMELPARQQARRMGGRRGGRAR